MKFSISILVLLLASAFAEDDEFSKDKRGTSSISSDTANALQEVSSKPQGQSDYVDLTHNKGAAGSPSVEQQGQVLLQSQSPQLQYYPGFQYIQAPGSPGRPNYVYQLPQQVFQPNTANAPHTPHQQPVAMILIPQTMHAQIPQGQAMPYYLQNQNAVFNQAAQQLLQYYSTHPEARLQLLQNYQQQQQPQTQQATQQATPGSVSATHPQLSTHYQQPTTPFVYTNPAQFAAAPAGYHQFVHPQSYVAYQQHPHLSALPAQYQAQPAAGHSHLLTTSSASSAATQPLTSNLNTNEYLPQAEKLTAASSTYSSPYALRNAYSKRY